MSEYNMHGKRFLDAERSLEILRKTLESIMGYEAKVVIQMYGPAEEGFTPSVIIKHVDWMEDFAGIFQRLRQRFSIDVNAEVCDCDICKEAVRKWGRPVTYLEIELCPIEETKTEKKEEPKKEARE
jgi:hypothetical protein